MSRNLSIRTKVLATLGAVLVAVVGATTTHIFFSERALVADVVREKALDTAYAYFDGVNTMMLTGTMGQRGTLREKLLGNPDVLEVRILRGQAVTAVFGPGQDSEQARDRLDREALAGTAAVVETEKNGARVVTVLQPMRASTDYRGTNCLTCHQVPEGTVLGAVRVTYSLASLDRRIGRNLLVSGLLNAAIFGLGVAVLGWFLQRMVFRRLRHMRDAMARIEADSDLTHRIDPGAADEIGAVGVALNRMLERFARGLHQVADTSHELTRAADRIATVAEQGARGVQQQRSETDSMATAITEMEATAQEVRRSAASTAESSRSADEAARAGTDLTDRAIRGIQQLVSEIRRAEEVIDRLDERSRNVGSVLDVIKGIAEQTNLLALNAAIEAARAGEKGRGFAVVADEVRTLATRSHESTQEIEKIIELLQREAREAVEVMGNARESAERRNEQVSAAAENLSRIAAQVASISELNTQMARAAEEQSTVTGDVSRNVATIGQIADRTAQDAGQTAQVSEELVNLARRLEGMLSQFRFG